MLINLQNTFERSIIKIKTNLKVDIQKFFIKIYLLSFLKCAYFKF